MKRYLPSIYPRANKAYQAKEALDFELVTSNALKDREDTLGN
jgi:hypothetical protein